MSRTFPLAGLLRLRHSQQDQAAAALAAAHHSHRDVQARRDALRIEASMTESEPVSPEALNAIAAARASSLSMLQDLDALCRAEADNVAAAQAAYGSARSRTVGLEKLSDRHRADWSAGQLKAEQGALDEMASSTRYRNQGEQ